MALKPRRGTWAYGAEAHTPVDAARGLAWGGPDEPGDWADFQVRSDIAIRRHQALVNCAFSFCWAAGSPPPGPAPDNSPERGHRSPAPADPGTPGHPSGTKLAPRAAHRPQLADSRAHAHALLAGMVKGAPRP
jgi:hypothetical protein